MSAICGHFHRDNKPAHSLDLAPVLSELEKFSFHTPRSYCNCAVALSQCNTDQDNDNKAWSASSSIFLVADARLDNREDLLRILEIAKDEWSGTSDEQLIIRAYQRWKTDTAVHLLGDFAFALWDAAEQQLFCARDYIGTRPFYYHIDHKNFIFASDIKALLSSNSLSRNLDLSYMRSCLEEPGFYHPGRTHWKNINRLPPAHSLVIRRDTSHTWSYWSPQNVEKVRYKCDTDYIDHSRALLQSAIDCRLKTYKQVGSHISGGLDSTTVSVLASRSLQESGNHLIGFSWAPPPISGKRLIPDERALIIKICEDEGISLSFTPIEPIDVTTADTRNVLVEPVRAVLWEAAVARISSSQNVGVMLSGWGGDELLAFNGRGHFAELLLRGNWPTLARELMRQSRLHGGKPQRTFVGRAILPLIPDRLLSLFRPDLLQGPHSRTISRYLTSDFKHQINSVQPLKVPQLRERPGVHRNQANLLGNGFLTDRMESWWALGAQHGIDYRYPLLDRRVAEFSLGIPGHLYFKNGWKRYLFRQATEGIIPDEVRWQKNKGDPAMYQHLTNIEESSDRLLFNELMRRHEKIVQTGLLDVDHILTGPGRFLVTGQKKGEQFYEAETAFWLAFLDLENCEFE